MKARILTTTTVRECHDGRNWDYRTPIEEPAGLRKATWVFRILLFLFFVMVGFAMCSLP